MKAISPQPASMIHATAPAQTPAPSFDPASVRRDFPLLARTINGRPLVYLDNASTSQKPQCVLDTLHDYYAHTNANVHRGVHSLSQEATEAYERARERVRRFLNAAEAREIVFVRGTTEGINLVAGTYGRQFIGADDEVLISEMEHHSNIVPWQILCEQRGAKLKVIPINDRGELIFEEYERLLSPRTKLVAVGHVSNALGTVNPVKKIIARAHEQGVPVLIDGAQAVPHFPVDVQELDCDFYAFSGHKVFGPTGIGVIYGKAEHLERMEPYQGGGDMILSVTFEKTIYNEIPYKFEAGTPNVADAIGLAAALDYLNGIGFAAIEPYEDDLLDYATQSLLAIDGVRLIGTARRKAGVLSFLIDGVHPHDAGTVLDQEGIAVRAGHHCAQPVMEHFGIPATVRASLAFYNTREEIDALATAVRKVQEMFN